VFKEIKFSRLLVLSSCSFTYSQNQSFAIRAPTLDHSNDLCGDKLFRCHYVPDKIPEAVNNATVAG